MEVQSRGTRHFHVFCNMIEVICNSQPKYNDWKAQQHCLQLTSYGRTRGHRESKYCTVRTQCSINESKEDHFLISFFLIIAARTRKNPDFSNAELTLFTRQTFCSIFLKMAIHGSAASSKINSVAQERRRTEKLRRPSQQRSLNSIAFFKARIS